VNVSFAEMMLSLVFWSAVLGAAGGILAVPLTMVLRKFITMNKSAGESEPWRQLHDQRM